MIVVSLDNGRPRIMPKAPEPQALPQEFPRLNSVRSRLGLSVVLVPCKWTTKVAAMKWSNLTENHFQKPDYLKKLEANNIAVILGPKHGNICTIDFDDDEAVEPFLVLNPKLREALRTKGFRGCNLWLKPTGEYPSKVIHLHSNPLYTASDIHDPQAVVRTIQDSDTPAVRQLHNIFKDWEDVSLEELGGRLNAAILDNSWWAEVQPPQECTQTTGNPAGDGGCSGKRLQIRARKLLDNLLGNVVRHFPLGESSDKLGEWRGGGCYTIIDGMHPKGMRYKVVHGEKPLELKYEDLIWPPWVTMDHKQTSASVGQPSRPSLSGDTRSSEVTDGTEGTYGLDDIGREVGMVVSHPEWAKCIPKEVHSTDSRQFRLARLVKKVEKDSRDGELFSREVYQAIFDRWYEESKAYLRPELEKMEYWAEFIHRIEIVKIPLGEDPFVAAMVKAVKMVLPGGLATELQGHAGMGLVAKVAYQMVKDSRDGLFFIPLRKGEDLFREAGVNVRYPTIGKWLQYFRSPTIGLITEAVPCKIAEHKSPRYRLTEKFIAFFQQSTHTNEDKARI